MGKILIRILPSFQHTDRRFISEKRGDGHGIRNDWFTRIIRSESILL